MDHSRTIALRSDNTMVFYIHSSMQDFDQKVGMLFGDSFLVTRNGPVALTNAPIGIVTKSAD
ncbi:hypothetical protein [Candidatus Burkholderia verschuerenii]|uniref:hypothetical protein n=1 Tax=Candidatus Burkholderia verschuerenii TaxID=242163 RepID=UPI0012EEA38E|nr:hypothetical protein [Candidatus Burkholderia verschuerenii]